MRWQRFVGADLPRWERRGVWYGALFLGVLVFFVGVYHWGMITLEGESQTVYESLQVVVETFTTIGYGSQAGWSSPAMNVLVVVMNLTSFVLVFMALPLVVVPLLEDALETSPPEGQPDATDHVLICGFTARGETLVEQLSAWETDYVIVVDGREAAQQLHEEGHPVVHGDPGTSEALERANVGAARAVVADTDDETNANVVLAAREAAPDVQVVATVQHPDDEKYLTYAGADEVLTPRHLLGRSLAEKVTLTVSTPAGDGDLGGDLEVAEVPVGEDSDVAGRTLAESGVRERTGVNVIGAWRSGEFLAGLGPDHEVDPGSVLLVAGSATGVQRFREFVRAGTEPRVGHVVVVGHGEVGSTVTSQLAASDVPYRVIDRAEGSSVDVVGDATDESVLARADVRSARAVVLAIPDDATTAFATLVARELAPDVEVVARADEADATRRLYLAGADYVLSLATVSGRMLASAVLDEEVISPEKQVEVVKGRAPGLAGQRVQEASIRDRTGCTVIAIERDGELLTEFGPGTVVRDDDELIVAGSDEQVRAFVALSH